MICFTSGLLTIFLRYIPQTRPIILLLDGHSSHYSPATIKFAAQQGILLYVLPPNTTHLTQPLDRGCFSPLKVKWRQLCHEFRRTHPGRVVMKFEFSHLFSEAWYASMSSENIVSSFRTTGICPFNRHALNHVPGMEKEESHLLHPKNLAEITGLSTYLCVVHLHAMLNLNLIVRVIIALQFQLYLTGSQLQCYNYSDYELPEKVVPPPDTFKCTFPSRRLCTTSYFHLGE